MKAISISGKSTSDIQAALLQCLANGFQPTLAFVFLSDLDEVTPVTSLMDAQGIAVFGVSTSQKFTEQGIEREGIVALMLDINPAYFKIILKEFDTATPYESASQVGVFGKNSFKNPGFIISVADYTTPGEDIIHGLLKAAGEHITVIGGVAGEYEHFTSCLFTNHITSNKGIISLIIDEEKIAVQGMAVSGWKPVGTEKTITKIEGTWIFTIDNEPAMDVLKKYLGSEVMVSDASAEFVNLDINYPLQIKRNSGKPMMRPVILWNTVNQSVMIGGPVKEGSMFRFSLPADVEVIDSVIDCAKQVKDSQLPDADAMLIFSCIGRLTSLGPMVSSEVEGLAAIWKVPMAGFFSLGEFGKLDDTRPEFHGTTVSWVALKEK